MSAARTRRGATQIAFTSSILESYEALSDLSHTSAARRSRGLVVRFADLTPGLVVRSPPRVVTQREMIEFATRYDPQWFHVDAARARDGRWRGLIASGWHTCAIAMELMVKNVLSGSESFGSPGIDSVKWQYPVRPDDAVALHFEVLRASKSPSNRTGIVASKTELWNQNDRQVLTLQGTTLFDIAAPRG